MERSFVLKIKGLFQKDSSYRITRSFALKMLPLSFLAGLFICFAIPVSYYFVSRQDMIKQAKLHASYIASVFRETLEMYPLDWKERLRKRLILFTDIRYVKFYNRRGDLIAELSPFEKNLEKEPILTVRKDITYAGDIYVSVEVGVSLERIQKYAFHLLIFSLICGTLEGIALFLLPVFEIQSVEEEVNHSRRLILKEQGKLKRSEEKYRTLFEMAPDGLVITTEDGEIISYNHSFLVILGIVKDKAFKQNIIDFYVDPGVREELLKELFEKGEVLNREALFKRSDGSEIPVLLSMKLISARIMEDELPLNYKPTFLIFNIIRDITKIKEIERQLIQAQKMESIGFLAGGIAHDFNNILAIILGFTELLKKRLRDSSLIQYVSAIESSALRAAGLVKNLLAFARAGKYHVEEVNLNEVVEEVVSFLEHTIEKKIRIIKELKPDLPLIKADPSQIYQVLLNLCVNARDAVMTKGGGKIILQTFDSHLERKRFLTGDVSEPGQYVAVSVIDDGPGIPPEILEKIFDPFFTTKKPGQGTGLGLSVVYGIVRNHGGYVDVLTKPGQGTEIIVYLPVSRQKEEEILAVTSKFTEYKRDKTKIKGHETILLVDDEEEVRKLCKAILEENGYKVLLAANGEEAIRLFKEYGDKIDLVLLDLIMPGKDGIEVFHELKRLDPNVKVILVTGYVMDKKAQMLLQEGAYRFLTKPYRFHELLGIIREVLQS